MDPARSLYGATPDGRHSGARLSLSSLPDSSPLPAETPAKRKTFTAASAYRSSSRSSMPPPSIVGNAMGRVTPSPSSSAINTIPSDSSHNAIKLLPSIPKSSPTSSTSLVWQRNRKLLPPPVNQIADEGSVQDTGYFMSSHASYDIDSSPLQHKEFDVSNGRSLKRARQNYTHISGECTIHSTQKSASSDIQFSSAPTDEPDAPHTEPATESVSVIRSVTRTSQDQGSVGDLVTSDATQMQQYEDHRKHWAGCSMDQWMQDGQELYAALERVLERMTVGLGDDMTSIRSLKVLLDAHHRFLADRDSALVDVKKVILGGRGVWTDDRAAY